MHGLFVVPLNIYIYFFSSDFSYFLLIPNLKKKKKKRKKRKKQISLVSSISNGSTNWVVTEPWIDKNWKLEEWIDKTEN